MSIYATTFSIEEDHEPGECAKWIECDKKDPKAAAWGDDGTWKRDEKAKCTCGNLGPPWIYQGSHVLPAKDDPRGGYVDLAYIPDHITRDGRDDGKEGQRKDWLRLGVFDEGIETSDTVRVPQDATVVLNRRQVQALRDSLTQWLERGPE